MEEIILLTLAGDVIFFTGLLLETAAAGDSADIPRGFLVFA